MTPQSEASTLYETGKRLYLSRPGPEEVVMAAAYFERAAELGFAPAQRVLGIMCLEGDQIPRDPAKAERWLSAAADQGDAQALFRLALMSARGEGIPKDWSRAYALVARPEAGALPEARELRRRLRGELMALYPELSKAIEGREAPYRASLDRAQRRLILPFLDPARDGSDRTEFEAWLALNLGRLTAEAALEVIGGRLDAYYRSQAALHPAGRGGPACP